MHAPSTLTFPLSRSIVRPATDTVSATHRTRWVFVSLCAYVLSQAYMLPIVPKGPTWAFWPALADFAVVALVTSFLFAMPHMRKPSAASRSIFCILLVVVWGWLFSYLYPILFALEDTSAPPIHGLYYLIRLVQFIAVFFVVAHLPLPPSRIATLRRVAGVALALTCISVVLTYFSIVPLSTFGARIPKSKAAAGPWIYYAHAPDSDLTAAELRTFGADLGLGTIGYNHGYTALQVMILLGLFLHLGKKEGQGWDNILLVLAIVACFLSESRDGLLGILLFSAVYWLRRPVQFLPVLALGGILIVGLPLVTPHSDNNNSFLSATLARQSTLFAKKSNDNLSGRQTIWKEKLDFLNVRPVRWVIGGGLGALWDDNTANAHMLYLQILVETGIVGLLYFFYIAANVLTRLKQCEGGMRPLFWMTIVLLITSLTQESFYPVAAFGHFVGLYLCAVAIALRNTTDTVQEGVEA